MKVKGINGFKDDLFYVFKKYLPKILIYPFVITYSYQGLRYAIKNDFDLTYSLTASFLSIIIFFFMVLELLIKFTSYEYDDRMPMGKAYCELKNDDRVIKIKAYHEAGHFVMAQLLGLPIKEVNIIDNANSGGQLILDMPEILRPTQIKHLILIKYAGAITEKIFIGEASDGCMGHYTSDMESANILLKKYIILTDDSISLTGYEEEYIKNKCIELSKLWEQEVSIILSENKKEIEAIAEELINKKIIKIM